MNFSYNQLPIYENDTRDTITEKYAALLWRLTDLKEIQGHLSTLCETMYSRGLADMDKMHNIEIKKEW